MMAANVSCFRDGCDESGLFVAGCVVKEMQEVVGSVSIAEAVQLIRAARPQFITSEVSALPFSVISS